MLLALVQGGMTRDDAYRVVQDNAMRAWSEGVSLRSLVERDPRVSIDPAGLDAAFDLQRSVRHAGAALDALASL